MIAAETRKLKILKDSLPKEKSRAPQIQSAQEVALRDVQLKEFQEEQDNLRREDAAEKKKSRDLVTKMNTAVGVEDKLDTIIGVLSDMMSE